MEWHIPQRQSQVAILVSIAKFFKGLLGQFWIIIPLILVGGDGLKTEGAFFMIFLFFGGFSLVLSIIGYFRFYFSIEDEEFVIRKGVLRKTEINLPIERIQSVNFRQGPIHQLFKVVGLEIDSAGANGKEFEIAALSKEKAEQLKEYLLEKRNTLVQLENGASTDEIFTIEESKELLFKHSPWDLFKIGISQNHLQTAGILLLFFFGLYDDISELFFDDIFDFIEKVMGVDVQNVLIISLFAIPLFLIASFVITLFRTVLSEFNLRFWKTNSGFQLKGGLINRKETVALLRKIQTIHASSNPIQRKLGLSAFRMNQAASTEVANRKSISVAGVYENQVKSILRHSYGDLLDLPSIIHKPDRRMIFRRFIFIGLLPAIAASIIAILTKRYEYFALPASLPLIYLYQRAYYNKFTFKLSTDLLVIKRGVLTQRQSYLELFKIQACQISQSPYQRRKNLAHLEVHTASGNLTIPFISLELAQSLHDVFMYRAEKTEEAWM